MRVRGGACFNIYDGASCVALTASLSAAVGIGAGGVSWSVAGVILVMNAAGLAIGRAGLRLPFDAFRPAAEYVFGILALALLSFALCRLFTISAGAAAGIAAVGGIAAGLWAAQGGRVRSSAGGRDVAVTLLVCAASLIWSWQAMIAVPRMLVSGHFDGWFDYFIHAGEIAQLADFHALRGTTIFAAGLPLPMYHYGSYMLPAALTGWTGILALTAATAFWTPFGYVLLGLGAGALGGVLAGARGGVFSVIAVMLIPSAAHYGLKNPFFDFHWLLQISSSGCYGLAGSCLAVAALVFWLRAPRAAYFYWLAGLTLSVFEFRVQVFAPLAAMVGLVCVMAWRPARAWRRWGVIAGGGGAVLLVMAALERIPRAPHFFTGLHHPIRLLLLMHGMGPSLYQGVYARMAQRLAGGTGIVHDLGLAVTLASGLLLLVLAAFGAWLPVYLAGLAVRRRGAKIAAEDWLPLASVAAYLALVTLFPSNPLEKLEFAQRPFVLPYVMLAIWCAKFAAGAGAPERMPARFLVLACAALLAVPILLEGKAQISDLDWGNHAVGHPVPAGLIAAAAYLRAHAGPGDVVMARADGLDEAFLALSERPEFLPGTVFLTIQSGISPAQYAVRAAAKEAASGVAWRLTLPPDPAPADSVFSDAGYAVEHLGQSRP